MYNYVINIEYVELVKENKLTVGLWKAELHALRIPKLTTMKIKKVIGSYI